MIFPACILFTVCRMNIAESSPDRSATGTDTCTESFFAIAVCIFLVDLQETIRQVVIINTIMILIVFVIVSGYWFPVTCSGFFTRKIIPGIFNPSIANVSGFRLLVSGFFIRKVIPVIFNPANTNAPCSLLLVSGFFIRKIVPVVFNPLNELV